MVSRINKKTDKIITHLALKLNYGACITLFLMMLITCVDIIMRFFRHPLPGAYELVGFFGSLTVAFALAATSLGKGHIAVEYLVSKFPEKLHNFIERINCFVCSIIFGVITYQTFLYSFSLKASNEVSMTLQVPLYPFSMGIAVGCAMVSIVMLFQSLNLARYGLGE
ncbi:MAG: TRAP transporter small permease [Desulforegulaceae bacterium]|nr:TRAP transporter small permease [Desulforegulaceae bacterium]